MIPLIYQGSVWPRKYGALGLSIYIAIGAFPIFADVQALLVGRAF